MLVVQELTAKIKKLNEDLEEAGQRLKEADTKLESNKLSLDAAEKTIDNLKRQIETYVPAHCNVIICDLSLFFFATVALDELFIQKERLGKNLFDQHEPVAPYCRTAERLNNSIH